jgi:glutaconate CoA-transferase subunit B
MSDWTPREMMTVAAAHQIRPHDVTVVGLGLPQVAALLAKLTHASSAVMLLELGVAESMPTGSTMGIADPRIWEGARSFGGMIDILGGFLHAGRVTLGILGALQIDPSGSINSSYVASGTGNGRRFNGSGGSNDIASLAGRVMVVMRHDPRKFRPRVDFRTSPGMTIDGQSRQATGLPGGGTSTIVTDRAVIEVNESGLHLASVHPGEDPEAVLADTPVPLQTGTVDETAAPTPEELALIREQLDPDRWYTA